MAAMKNRVLARDVASHVDSRVTIQGWLHKTRKMGGLNFINVRDRSGLTQILIEDKDEVEKLRGMQIGTVLTIEGLVHKDERAPGGAELHEPAITVEVPVDETPPIEIDKPIDHNPENHDTLFENRGLGLRNPNEQKTFRIRASLNRYIREFMHQNEFVEIQTPKLLAGASEGGAEVFKLDYYGKEATLAQSPQLYKQMMVGVFERVFEIGPTYRAELSSTSRHLSEVTMLDMEMGFIESHDDVLKMTEKLMNHVLRSVYEEHADDLKSMNAPALTIKDEFPRFTVAEVHEMYSKATKEDTTQEKDLIPAEERWICDFAKKNLGCELVFVTNFPIEAMKFYHMVDEETNTVRWADMLFRGLELATIPQREHRHDRLVQQIKDAGMNPEDPGYKYFLQAMKFGLPPHGGFGFGIDRLTEMTVGLKNVKEAVLFPRDLNRLAP